MEKIFIIWRDYDGTYIETFDSDEKKKEAEERCAEIMAKGDDYGTEIDAVIQGKELKTETIEVVSKVLLR